MTHKPVVRPDLSLAAAAPQQGRNANASTDLVVFIVPDRHHRVRRFRVSLRRLKQWASFAAVFLLLVGAGTVHYLVVLRQARRVPELTQQHLALRARLSAAQEELNRLSTQVSAIDRQIAQVRAITQLNDPARNLALGPDEPHANRPAPVLYVQGERTEYEDEMVDSRAALRLLDQGLDSTKAAGQVAATAATELTQFLAQRATLVATTPSIRPVSSRLVASRFGPRRDVFTGAQVVHKGIDFLADIGSPIWAPADGHIIFVGARGQGLGDTVVIDHGFGVQTHFAHLSRIDVALGDAVRRGQKLAEVGNSGRSIGAHLHYEVRFNGLPQDPEPYLLD